MSLRGNTKEFPLEVLLRLLGDTKKTGELSVRGAGVEGALGIAEGRVVTAVFGDEPAIPALGAVFKIADADFEFTEWAEAPPANLEGELQDNLRKAEEYGAWLASVRQVIPHDGIAFRLSERAAEAGAVTFTPDRWRVVLAVNGQRNVNDMASHLHIDRDAALTTLAGLVRDGVIETVDAPAPASVPPAPSPPPAAESSAPAPATPEPAAPAEDWTAALLPRAAPATETPLQPEPPRAEPPPIAAAPEPAPEPAAPAAADWGTPVTPEPAVQEWGATAPPAAPDWGTPATTEPAAADWGAPAPTEPPPQEWAAPAPSEPAPPPVDERLAALFGAAPVESAPSAPPAPGDWATPQPAEWAAPAVEAPAPAIDDARLGALTPPPVAPANEWEAPPPAAPANEWEAPPPAEVIAPPPQKKGGFFGRFKREEQAPEPATRTTLVDRSASSRAGLLAAFSNALLAEYNSGHYGKGRVDDRIGGLLMRVDEQADPIDKPLPVVDDRLDVQAFERVALPEQQSVPYLAMLVSTIYGDAEKAFGRDKAKRGYRAAQQHVFGTDTSALYAPDIAGKLPKV